MDLKLVAKKLKEARGTAGLTQKKLASESGVALATIQEIEGGNGNPTVETLNTLADTLKIDGLELFGASSGAFDVRGARDLLTKFQDAPPDIQKLVLTVLTLDTSHLKTATRGFRQHATAFLKAALSL